MITRLLACLLILTIFACGEPEDENNVEDFEILGRWNFEKVAGSGQIFGVPQSDKDDDPTGYIEFYEFDKGLFDFNIELLSQTIGKQENVQWERVDKFTIDIEEEDGSHQIWKLINANDSIIEADWFLDFGSGNQATINMTLVR